jgi:hypothetical protein
MQTFFFVVGAVVGGNVKVTGATTGVCVGRDNGAVVGIRFGALVGAFVGICLHCFVESSFT